MLVRVEVEGIYYDAKIKSPLVMLKEAGGDRRVPIWIGAFEALAILIGMNEAQVPRPITHDLTAELIKRLKARVARIEVTRIEEGAYHSVVHVETPEGTVEEVDSRPSDAIALAVRFAAPLYVSGALFEAGQGREMARDAEYWKKYLEGLDADAFGKYRM